ncbi:uncharacterized protein LOC126993023 [Eriocheir sinensis]|uniref:uncharacterized protein LOC126993023 n=1 Tax=Eriocheir sinensis TaxID=95602 RepID=UPI0021C5A3B5|nr:uncharacterized protein LOC126993023 [Eriocheir sinensis]
MGKLQEAGWPTQGCSRIPPTTHDGNTDMHTMEEEHTIRGGGALERDWADWVGDCGSWWSVLESPIRNIKPQPHSSPSPLPSPPSPPQQYSPQHDPAEKEEEEKEREKKVKEYTAVIINTLKVNKQQMCEWLGGGGSPSLVCVEDIPWCRCVMMLTPRCLPHTHHATPPQPPPPPPDSCAIEDLCRAWHGRLFPVKTSLCGLLVSEVVDCLVPEKEQQALLTHHSPLQATKKRRKTYGSAVIENGSEKIVEDITPDRKGEFGDEKSVMSNKKEGDDLGEARLVTPKDITGLGKQVKEDMKRRKASGPLTNENLMKGRNTKIGRTTSQQDPQEFSDGIGSRQAPGLFNKAQVMKESEVKAKSQKIKGLAKQVDLDEVDEGITVTQAPRLLTKPNKNENTATGTWQRRTTRIKLPNIQKDQLDRSQVIATNLTNLKQQDHHYHQDQATPRQTITKSSPVPSSDIPHLLPFLHAKFKSNALPSRKPSTSSGDDDGPVRCTEQEREKEEEEELKKKGQAEKEDEKEHEEEEKTEEEKEHEKIEGEKQLDEEKNEEKKENEKEIEKAEQEEEEKTEKGKENKEVEEKEKEERKIEEAEQEGEKEQEHETKEFKKEQNENETTNQKEKEETKEEKKEEEEAEQDNKEEEKEGERKTEGEKEQQNKKFKKGQNEDETKNETEKEETKQEKEEEAEQDNKEEEKEKERKTEGEKEQENEEEEFKKEQNEDETKNETEKEEEEEEEEEEVEEDDKEEEKNQDKGVPNSRWREMLAWHQQKKYVQYLERHSDPRIPPWTGFLVSKSAPPSGVLAPTTEPFLSYGSMGVASVLAVMSLSLGPGDALLDLCAANGYHTLLAALHMKDRGLVVSNLLTCQSLPGVQEVISTCGLTCVLITRLHLLRLPQVLRDTFTHVLVNAPCGGSDDRDGCGGVTPGSHVWFLQQCLVAGLDALRPGGVLVYLTASGRVEDNEAIVEHVKQCRPAEVLPLAPPTLPAAVCESIRFESGVSGCLRVISSQPGSGVSCLTKLKKVT